MARIIATPHKHRSKDGKEVTDEIALNRSHFLSCTTEQSLSTPATTDAALFQQTFCRRSIKFRSARHRQIAPRP
jgi:hypothetical protein